jgi:hypothetical protein
MRKEPLFAFQVSFSVLLQWNVITYTVLFDLIQYFNLQACQGQFKSLKNHGLFADLSRII